MKHFVLLFFIGIVPINLLISQSQYKVYFFLLEDCKISQAYISEIKRIEKEFANDSIRFVALFPNATSTEQSVLTFNKRYKLPMLCKQDVQRMVADQYQISVLPEVVVINETQHQKLYQGRIDNLFVAIGKRRKKATTFDLKEVLKGIVSGQQLPYRKTAAIGCFLSHWDN
ncbi:MAG: hypothetical protein IPK91_04035 [Saprospiraceae bacterium]|jgi:hypothetical protein|nr:hypothetical protein [Saprospiraceae bacterium]MBK8296446.1 hypothetical protein [Saprospiraceae bacterium]